MNNSATFSIFIKLCNHCCLVPNHFHHPKRTSMSAQQSLPAAPAKSASLLSLWIHLLCIFHIDRIIQYVAFCVGLLSLSLLFWRFIPVACVSTSFLFMAGRYSSMWMGHNLVVQSSMDGHLGCFYLLAVANGATRKVCVPVFI